MIAKRLDRGLRRVKLLVPYDRGGILELLYRESEVERVDYGEKIEITAICSPEIYGQVRQYLAPEEAEENENN